MSYVVDDARDFALNAHADQKYGDKPYIDHLDHVAFFAELFGASDTVLAAAYLHDTLEDTKTTYDDLVLYFGTAVADLVVAVTSEHGRNRQERVSATLPKTRAAGTDAVLLKLCDRIANVSASAADNPELLKMYEKEQPLFEKSLRQPGEHDAVWLTLTKAFRSE